VALAMLPNLTSLIAFGSAAFLAVYTLVNYLQARLSTRTRDRMLAWFGMVTCIAALAALGVELSRDDPWALIVLALIALTVALGRVLFVRRSQIRALR
jgi:hypothetical protein